MEEKKLIPLLQKVLITRKRVDLSQLLDNARGLLNESSTFGSMWNSTISSFDIYTSINKFEILETLPDTDKEELLRAVHAIYPVRENEPEVVKINFYPDVNIEDSEFAETPELDSISFSSVKNQQLKCKTKVENGDFEGAITNARTLLESVCLYIIESTSENPIKYDGNLLKLYKTTAKTLSLSTQAQDSLDIKQLLSGIVSIVNGISALRNSHSDSHGKPPSQTAIQIDRKHALLAVNSCVSLSEYLYATYKEQIEV